MHTINFPAFRGSAWAHVFSLIITPALWLAVGLVGWVSSLHAAQFTGISPNSGLPGTLVTLSATGLNPNQTHTVTVNGRAATMNQVTATNLRFTVTASTTSGAIVVNDGSGPVDSGLSFTMLRTIQGVFAPPPTVSRTGYSIAGSGEFVTPNPTTGVFTVKVPLDRALTVMAFRNDNDPVFMAVVTSANGTLTVNAASTAAAMTFMSPFLATRDDARAQSLLGRMAGLPEITNLAGLISNLSRDGVDYLPDNRFESALVAATQAALRAPTGPNLVRAQFTPPSLLKEINPDYSAFVPVTPVRLSHTLTPPTNAHPDAFKLTVENVGNNPADWMTEILELDAGQFADGRNSVQALQHTDAPLFASATQLGRGYVRAKLVAAKGDLIERLANFITDYAFSAADKRILGPGDYLLNTDRPGVYVAQSFSGNLYYGTEFFTVVRSQSALLDQVNANSLWHEALAANLAIAMIDVVSVAIDFTSFAPGDANDLVMQIVVDCSKAVQLYRNRPEGITMADLYDLVKTLTAATLKTVIKSAGDKGSEFLLARYTFGAAKALAKTIDILGKISAVGQAIERGIGVVAPDTLAVERAVIVVGNPFEPRILNFHPQRGRAGAKIHISGFNFPENTNEVSVSFCTYGSTIPQGVDPDTLPSTATLPARVLASSQYNLIIEVPDGWEQAFNTDWAYLCIETGPDKRTSTLRLEDPYHVFTHIGKPQLTGVNPDPVPASALMTIRGRNFEAAARLDNQVIMDDSVTMAVANATADTLVVRVPFATAEGPHTVKVKLYGRESNPITFNVVDPVGESQGYTESRTITITRADMSNSADGEVSILEAFLIANGTLGRNIEVHLDCEFLPPEEPGACAYRERETDHVGGSDSGSDGGFVRDTIQVDSSLFGQTVALSAALPPPGDGDTYNLNGLTFDGAGAPANASAWRMDNRKGVVLSGGEFRNFPAHGVHILNGSYANNISSAKFIGCGLDGVFLDGDARLNSLNRLTITRAGRHGVHLSGTNVIYNGFNADSGNVTNRIEQCQGHGVLLENGAAYNVVYPATVISNALDGVRLQGELTDMNVIGRNQESRPPFCAIHKNGGNGITLLAGVQHTVLRYLNPAGNAGDGVRMDGANCSYNQADGIFTGADYTVNPPVLLANGGNGIHLLNGAATNLIGSFLPGGYGLRNSIAGNLGAGVLLDGPNIAYNTINHINVGDIDPALVGPIRYFPNGTHGIHLRNGAHHNTIGNHNSWLDCHISAQPNGAGIMIEGAGTDHNLILGNQIGSLHGANFFPPEGRLQVGIHLKNGPKGTIIGEPGAFFEIEVSPFTYWPYRPYNVIGNATRAGIVLENCGGDLDANGRVLHPNQIVNNYIGRDDYNGNAYNLRGIVLTNNARKNIIGGTRPGHGNRLWYNREAGIAFENNHGGNELEANRIIGNQIVNSGQGVGNYPEPLQNVIPGAGILIQGNSTSNVIGGDFALANNISQNLVGVYIDGASGNHLAGQWIANNTLAGVIIRNGQNNRVGGGDAKQRNVIVNNGNNNANRGGILIAQGGGHQVEGNAVGADNPNGVTGGNRGSGVYLTNTVDNWIGGSGPVSGNTIVNNTGDGVRIAGSGSDNNVIRNNTIGTDAALRARGNGGNGVRFEAGASGNLVGGRHARLIGGALIQVRMPNTIAHNANHGILVHGSATAGNRFLYNSITANGADGIALQIGGNHDQPPPLQLTYDGFTLAGTVSNLTEIPAGSTIQVFADPDPAAPEGRQFLGETTVLPGGAWSLRGAIAPFWLTLSMTSTHATTGSTSPFGAGSALNIGFRLTRATPGPPASNRPALAGGGLWPVLPLQASALNADVVVTQLVFSATGSLDDRNAVQALRLFRDADNDGRITSADQLLALGQFDMDNGTATLALTNARVAANTVQQWILAYDNLSATATGATFSVELTATDAVRAMFTFPLAGPATPGITDFPVQSDSFAVQAAASVVAWRNLFFTSAELANPNISGNQADPDGDGLANFVEYALGLNPRSADSFMGPKHWRENDRLYFTYRRSLSAAQAQFIVRASQSLPNLLPSTGWFEEASVSENDDGTESVVLRSTSTFASHPRLFLLLRCIETAGP